LGIEKRSDGPIPPPGTGCYAGAYAGTGYVAATKYAGFLVRVVAAIIDGVLLFVVQLVLNQFIDDISARSLVNTVIGWLYYAGLESSGRQATLGKMALGLAVTDVAGNRISFLRATGRYFAKILSALILLIGFIMVAFTEKKQGLHDMIAGTLVVKTR
jgi:uncharacterized RDD family membrane protein YckC